MHASKRDLYDNDVVIDDIEFSDLPPEEIPTLSSALFNLGTRLLTRLRNSFKVTFTPVDDEDDEDDQCDFYISVTDIPPAELDKDIV